MSDGDPPILHAGFSEDSFLGGRVFVRQPLSGPRAGIDPVLMAAAVPARPGQRVLDVGTGSGVAACCLAERVPGLKIVGLELVPGMVDLARENARLNGLDGADEGPFQVVSGDVVRPPDELGREAFDHVLTNPPFVEAGRGTRPPHDTKAAAHVEDGADLGQWVDFCLAMARRKGTLTFIHRADRVDALLAALCPRAGGTIVFPLWPRQGEAAKRVIVQARKGVAAPARISPGLVLHQTGSRDFTAQADAVLRGGEALHL